ncbi:MAG: hypothetical protein L6Q99_21855 [Planctomycetes bacterium]|nr:hypothetical protein [Planctomycetota bacterium]
MHSSVVSITWALAACVTLTQLGPFAFAAQRAQKPDTQREAPASSASSAAPTLADSPTARRWSAWAAEHGHKVTPMGAGRVLCVHPASRTSLGELTKTVDATVARFDELAGAQPAEGFGREEPAVLLDLADRTSFGAAMDELAEQNRFAATWLRGLAANPSDFVLEEPVVGALAFFTGEREEWDPMNEVAHRVAHLLLVQRFGHQPNWLRVGLSWTIEQDVRGSIYCFPGRSDFVSVAEHGGWSDELVAAYKPKSAPAITIEELTKLSRGTFKVDAAARAWGAARYLAEHERDALPKILADLRAAWERDSRETRPDGSWVRKADFELDAAAQAEIFERHAGPELWRRMTTAFREARRLTPASVKPVQKSKKR